MAVESRRHVGHGSGGVVDLRIGHTLGQRRRQAAADHGRSALFHGGRDEVVAVALRTRHGEETCTRLHSARIVDERPDFHTAVAVQLAHLRAFQQFEKMFHSSIAVVFPLFRFL